MLMFIELREKCEHLSAPQGDGQTTFLLINIQGNTLYKLLYKL